MAFLPGIVPPAIIEKRVWFVVHPRGLVVASQETTVSLPGDEILATLALDVSNALYLGRIDDAEAFAVAAPTEDPPEPLRVRPLFQLYGALPDEAFAVAGRASQLVDWAQSHRFCGRCATPTIAVPGERCLRCPACGLSAYPRIAPAVIVLVRKGDEALLAHGSRFPAPFYSTLAGFVEVGESLEETIAREIREEVGIEVTNFRYFGSQPWPFPHSLMIGFMADWAGGDIRIDQDEIVDARWFRADELPLVPPPLSIARRLIDRWVDDVRGT